MEHKKIAEELKKLGKTQEEFAEEIDISDRYVRNLETTDKNISISMAYSISQVFGVMIEGQLSELHDEEDEDEDDEANS